MIGVMLKFITYRKCLWYRIHNFPHPQGYYLTLMSPTVKQGMQSQLSEQNPPSFQLSPYAQWYFLLILSTSQLVLQSPRSNDCKHLKIVLLFSLGVMLKPTWTCSEGLIISKSLISSMISLNLSFHNTVIPIKKSHLLSMKSYSLQIDSQLDLYAFLMISRNSSLL